MLGKIDVARFSHRTYVVSTGDAFSADKARRFESNLEQRAVEMKRQADASVALEAAKEPDGVPLIPSQVLKKRRLQQDARGSSSSNMKEARESTSADYTIQSLPRARHVHQSIFTTPVTALHSLFVTLRSLRSQPYPDVIITNGPATGVIVILASIILRFFDVRGANSLDKMRTIYVESWARVKTLSLSGKLLVTFADRFLVQWEALDGCANGKGEYRGVLV